MTDYVIAGNSHVAALRQGFDLLAAEDGSPYVPHEDQPDTWRFGEGDTVRLVALGNGRYELAEFSRNIRGRVQLTGRPARNLKTAFGSSVIEPDKTWAFLNLSNSSRIFSDVTWKSYAPSALGQIAGRAPLTQSAVRSIIGADHAPVMTFYEQLREVGIRPVAVEAPRPQRSHRSLRSVDDLRIARHIDALDRSMWADWLEGHGIPHVSPPESTVADDGFLRTEFRKGGVTNLGKPDHTHGNAEFGRAYLPSIIKALTFLA